MAKLGNLVKGNVFRITQSPHGRFQNYKALDFTSGDGSKSIVAPCDVEVKSQRVDSYGNPFFEIFNNNWKIQLVHCNLIVAPGFYPKGAVIGNYTVRTDKFADHIHGTIQVAGTWYPLLDFMDRSIQLTLGSGFRSQRWKNWSMWADRQLTIGKLVPDKPDPAPNYDKEIKEINKKINAIDKSLKDTQNKLRSV